MPAPLSGPARAAWPRFSLVSGALLGFATVACGALAAHLPDRMLVPGGREMLRGAVQMQGWHAAALLLIGALAERQDGWPLRLAAILMLCGIASFCGGVYSLAFGTTVAGWLAPLGGTLAMVGWLLLAVAAVARRA
ncbi:DUF423 domain-containing protein [Rhizosaccharibacter radicis]|uniref:DUF423 domain-containing protein n=1 Tax=Rhizosaccharibacter radicis TaxID=2782605 RepID=A0ABT1W3R4_9PROT|nr:DUF423 domain-containing protein [Acetobacteraceae bacterium KSS12]